MREKQIIESGMKLFAQKGYHRTSIQEITEKSGISKGTFYLYFQSKEEFIAKTMKYFYDKAEEQVMKGYDSNLSPDLNFMRQINNLATYIYEQKDFIIMYLQTMDQSFGARALKSYEKIRIGHFQWIQSNIVIIYGKSIEPYIYDLVLSIEGILKWIFHSLIFDEMPIAIDRIGEFVLERSEDIVKGMIRRQSDPLIPRDKAPKKFQL